MGAGSIWPPAGSQANAAEQAKQPTQYLFHTEKLTRYQFPTHMNDLIIDRDQAANSEAFVVVLKPGHAPPLHIHNDMEQIFYILTGHGTLTIGKGEGQKHFPVKPGDVVLIPVSTYHSIHNDADKGDLTYFSVDCFGPERNAAEPTWDSHVKTLCREQGWDYSKVVIPGGGGSSAK